MCIFLDVFIQKSTPTSSKHRYLDNCLLFTGVLKLHRKSSAYSNKY